jgi:RND family efflux transporter MFP subunit
MNFETRIASDYSGSGYVSDGTSTTRRKRWLQIGAVILIALLLAAGYYFMNRKSDVAASPGITPSDGAKTGKETKQAADVTVIVPGRQQVTNFVSATGTLAARREMPVGAVGEGGLVQRVLVEPGQWVQAGQVLATIDRAVQTQESAQLAAQINVTQADARLAQSELDRALSLVKNGFISKADIDRKTATRDSALARVRVAQAQLNGSRARVGRLDIRAPAGGLVLTRSVEPGQVVSAGSGVLFRLARGGEMELRALISEVDLVHMVPGLSAAVTPVGSSTPFYGRIWQLSPVIDPQSRQGTVRVALGYNSALRPGGFASAKIAAGVFDAPILPQSAIQSDDKGSFVYTVGGGNKVERRGVTLGSVTDAGAAIASGLTGEERVVLSAGAFLNDGETVKPHALSAPAGAAKP